MNMQHLSGHTKRRRDDGTGRRDNN